MMYFLDRSVGAPLRIAHVSLSRQLDITYSETEVPSTS